MALVYVAYYKYSRRMKIKKCSKCGQEKSADEFFKSGKQKSGKPKFRGDCKTCASKDTGLWRIKNRSHYNNYAAKWRAENPEKHFANELRRRYGLSAARYHEMLGEQGHKCRICSVAHDPTKKRKCLYVDHDHKTGRIRGLLCGSCNIALGNFRESIETMESAIAYLKA